jgi:hypothetical protein
MTFCVKVPPNKGKCACIFKFENANLVGSVLQYDTLIVYCDMRYNQWLDDKHINKRMSYKSFEQQNHNTDVKIVVPSVGFFKNEIVFNVPLLEYDLKIPTLDQMICMYYNIHPTQIVYQKNKQKINDAPKESEASRAAMLSLLGKKKKDLSRSELKALGW